MSTFEGKLLEESLDFIRIDEFQQRNHDGTAFFLSHFHTDHFKGIFDNTFLKELKENDSKMLYCSSLTKTLIANHYKCRIPSYKIVPLNVSSPFILLHEDRDPVQVTAVSAGHCPGSVMFLFEQGSIRVLYTGDFRINPSDISKFKDLHDKTGAVKAIKTLYLDTTFCDPKYVTFPSREQSKQDLINLVTEWLGIDTSHEVGIRYNSYHGLEPLLIELAGTLKTRVWIMDIESYMNYSCIPELHAALSKKKNSTRIHLCPVKTQENCSVCVGNRDKTRTIKPCAQSFNRYQLELSRQKEGTKGLVRLAYSTHCSLEELIATVKYLSPESIHPCALPTGLSAEQVLRNLELDVERLKNEDKENHLSSVSESPPLKRFCLSSQDSMDDLIVPVKQEHVKEPLLTSEDEDDKPLSQNDLSLLDSPPL